MRLLCVVVFLGCFAQSSANDGDLNSGLLSRDVNVFRTRRAIGEGSLLLSPDPFLPDPSSPSAASAGSSGTTSALPPQLLETPRGGYVSRSQPVSLHCRADHVLHVYFRCNGRVAPQHREHSLADLVDPQTGVRQLEKQLLVEWQDVEQLEQEVSRSGAGDGVYRCECVAWSSRGENVSRPAEIRLAYLRKQFRSPPFSESVELGHSAELRCVPPEGSPVPTISWLKNGVEVSERVSDNYMVTGEASLLVVAAGLQDMANYSCVAENTANRRVSPPALLTVHVNGGWSDWGSWSPCTPRCGEGHSHRRRQCDSPRPVNGGLDCIGSSSQQRRCSTVCQPVDGGWSEFGSWSPCDSSCRQFRSRSCSNPQPAHGGEGCEGEDTVARNCTSSQCSDIKVGMERRGNKGVQSDVALYSGLAAALLLVTVVALVLVKLHQRKPRHRSVYGLRDHGYEARFYSSKKQLTYTPDLTSDVTVLTNSTPPSHNSDANYNQYKQNNKKRGMYLSPSEHHYDEPHLSLMNHIDVSSPLPSVHCVSPSRGAPLVPSADIEVQDYTRSPVMSPVPLSLNQSSSPAFSSFSGSGSLGKADTNSEQYHALLPSTLPSVSDAEVIDIKRVGCEGGVLSLPNFGVSLTIPEGALPAGLSEDFYLTVGTDSKDRPPIAEHETLLSPVITAGACVGANLLKPAIISFHHCACLNTPWTVSLLSCHPNSDSRGHWQRVATLDQNSADTGVYLHLDSSKAYIVTDTLHRFSIVGQPAESDEPCVRNMKLAAFGPRLTPGSVQYSLRVYAIEDTRAALESVVRLERKLGGRLLDKAKSWSLQSNGEPLCLSLEDLSVGWKCRPKSNYQEIPFVHVWSGGSPLLHCAFILQSSRGPSSAPTSASVSGGGSVTERLSFSARVQVYQRDSQHRRQMLRISCAESSSTTQSSDSSVPSPRLMSSSLTASGNVTSSLNTGDDANFRMSAEVKRALCSLLDTRDTMGNDWRLLAQLMHMQRFESYFAAQGSPTERLLDLWLARSSGSLVAPSGVSNCQRSAIVQLLSLLRAMDRHDAASLVEHSLTAHL